MLTPHSGPRPCQPYHARTPSPVSTPLHLCLYLCFGRHRTSKEISTPTDCFDPFSSSHTHTVRSIRMSRLESTHSPPHKREQSHQHPQPLPVPHPHPSQSLVAMSIRCGCAECPCMIFPPLHVRVCVSSISTLSHSRLLMMMISVRFEVFARCLVSVPVGLAYLQPCQHRIFVHVSSLFLDLILSSLNTLPSVMIDEQDLFGFVRILRRISKLVSLSLSLPEYHLSPNPTTLSTSHSLPRHTVYLYLSIFFSVLLKYQSNKLKLMTRF